MISLLRLHKHLLISLQLGRIFSRSSLNSLQHLPVLQCAPATLCNWIAFFGIFPVLSTCRPAHGSLLRGCLLSLNGIVLSDNLIHVLLDLFQTGIGLFTGGDCFTCFFISCFGGVEIVVESVIDPGSNCYLSFGEWSLDCHGHNVCRGVTDFE